MPVVQLSNVVLVIVDIAAWATVHSATGLAVHMLPVRMLERDHWLFVARRFEADGRLYTESLHIKRWKDTLPEAGALFPGGMSKRQLPRDAAGGLARFAVETRRAELGHWLAMVPAPVFVLWNPIGISAIMIGYAIAVNLPFIAIQRYNRIRVARVLRSSASRSTVAARARNEPGTNGASMP